MYGTLKKFCCSDYAILARTLHRASITVYQGVDHCAGVIAVVYLTSKSRSTPSPLVCREDEPCSHTEVKK